ncbi:MAG TPA: hypothetical protein VE078_02615 [Thermoanaerobaculia bacterium]|nr:hypothetical protein [Thermoanaerobaculia bacterium]
MKNRPMLAVLLLAGVFIVALGQLTGAIDSILGFSGKYFQQNEQSAPDDEYRPSPLLEPGEAYEQVTTAYVTTTPRGPLFEVLGRSQTDPTIVLLGTNAGGIVEESLSRPSLTMVGEHGPVFRGNAPLRIGDRVRIDLALMKNEQYVLFTIIQRGKIAL